MKDNGDCNENDWNSWETSILLEEYVDLVRSLGRNLNPDYEKRHSNVFELLAKDLRRYDINKTDVQCESQVKSVLGRRNAIVQFANK